MKKPINVVVVGGGFGGVKTALNLANKPGFLVQLISNNTHFEYHGALYRSAVGHSPREVVIPLRDIFKHAKNVELVLDSVGFVDAKKQLVASQAGEVYPYDKLVLALGNTVNYFGIEGLAEHTETMHDISSTLKLRKSLVELFKQPGSKPIRIAVVGAGASGVELAGELPAFAGLVAKKYQQPVPKLKINLIDGADRVLPLLSTKASTKTAAHLEKLGVNIHLNIKVQSCQSGEICLDAGNLEADLIIWTAGSKPVNFFSENPDVFTLARGGRVVVDEYLRPQNNDNMFVLGDNADTPYSGMAQTALHDANFVSRNLVRQAKKQPLAKYRPRRPVYVVTAGPKWAVVERGRKTITGYRGWLVRRQADLAIFKQFEPLKQAIKTWRSGQKMSEL